MGDDAVVGGKVRVPPGQRAAREFGPGTALIGRSGPSRFGNDMNMGTRQEGK